MEYCYGKSTLMAVNLTHTWLVCVCVCVCVWGGGGVGSIAKWLGSPPGNRKVPGLIPSWATLVLLLFP